MASFQSMIKSLAFVALTSQAFAVPFKSPYGNWSSVTCGDITDYADNIVNSWITADVSGAYEEALNHWDNTLNGPASVENGILTFFNGPSNWNCSDIGLGGDGCNTGMKDCVNPAALYLIGQSFSAVQDIHAQLYQQLANCQGKINTEIPNFAATFAPQIESDVDLLKDILDISQLIIGLQSAYLWNAVLKTSSIFTNEADKAANTVLQNLHGQAKDSANAAISFSITTAKDNLPAVTDALSTQNSLLDAMGKFIDHWQDITQDYLKYLFSGKGDSLSALDNHIAGGIALGIPPFGASDLENNALRVTYAYLIQKAWQIAPGGLKPVIIGPTSDPCNQQAGPAVKAYMDDNTAAQTQVCTSSGVFYVVNVIPVPVGACDPLSRDCFGPVGNQKVTFGTLPGGTPATLSGDADVWGGITLSDIVTSSYGGYQLNGNKNGYVLPEDSTYIAGDGTQGDLIFQAGVETPGVFGLMVCNDAGTVAQNGNGAVTSLC